MGGEQCPRIRQLPCRDSIGAHHAGASQSRFHWTQSLAPQAVTGSAPTPSPLRHWLTFEAFVSVERLREVLGVNNGSSPAVTGEWLRCRKGAMTGVRRRRRRSNTAIAAAPPRRRSIRANDRSLAISTATVDGRSWPNPAKRAPRQQPLRRASTIEYRSLSATAGTPKLCLGGSTQLRSYRGERSSIA